MSFFTSPKVNLASLSEEASLEKQAVPGLVRGQLIIPEMSLSAAQSKEHGLESEQCLGSSPTDVQVCFWMLHFSFLSLNFLISTFLLRIRDNIGKGSWYDSHRRLIALHSAPELLIGG